MTGGPGNKPIWTSYKEDMILMKDVFEKIKISIGKNIKNDENKKNEIETQREALKKFELPLEKGQKRRMKIYKGNDNIYKLNVTKDKTNQWDELLKDFKKAPKGARKIAKRFRNLKTSYKLDDKENAEDININEVNKILYNVPDSIRTRFRIVLDKNSSKFGKKRKSKFGSTISSNELLPMVDEIQDEYTNLCNKKNRSSKQESQIKGLQDLAVKLGVELHECTTSKHTIKSSNITSVNDLVNHINTEIDEINSNTDIVYKRIEKMLNKLKSKDNEIVELKNKIKLLETENTRGNKALEKAHKLELNSLRQNLNQQIRAYEDRMNEISVAINSREIEWSKKVSKLEESMEKLRRESEIKSENIKKDGQEDLELKYIF